MTENLLANPFFVKLQDELSDRTYLLAFIEEKLRWPKSPAQKEAFAELYERLGNVPQAQRLRFFQKVPRVPGRVSGRLE